MPEYLSPGVYVEEIDAGPKPIAAVATSTAGAVGVTLRGPTTPTLVTNYGEFVRTFGGPLPIPTTRQAGVGRPRPLLAGGRVDQGVLRRGRRARVLPARRPERRRRVERGLQRRAVSPASAATSTPPTRRSRSRTCSGSTPGATLDARRPADGVDARHGHRRERSTTRPDASRSTAAAGVSARRGRDLVAILPVDAALDVLTRDGGQRRRLGRRPQRRRSCPRSARASRSPRRRRAAAPVTTKTTADAAAKAHRDHGHAGRRARSTRRRRCRSTSRSTAAPPVAVTAVADAGARRRPSRSRRALRRDVPAGSEVTVVRRRAVAARS